MYVNKKILPYFFEKRSIVLQRTVTMQTAVEQFKVVLVDQMATRPYKNEGGVEILVVLLHVLNIILLPECPREGEDTNPRNIQWRGYHGYVVQQAVQGNARWCRTHAVKKHQFWAGRDEGTRRVICDRTPPSEPRTPISKGLLTYPGTTLRAP